MSTLNNFFEILSNLILPKGDILNQDYDTYLEERNLFEYKPFLKQVDFVQEPLILDYIWVCADYDKFGIANLLRRAKILSEWAIAIEISNILIFQFQNQIQASDTDIQGQNYHAQINLNKPDYITFVPPDPSRLRKRGYHIPQIIAKTVAKKLNIPLIETIQKPKTTISQTELNREERLISLNHVLTSTKTLYDNNLDYKHIWLIDDFTTTGTSLYQSAKVINSIYPKAQITAIALAGSQ
jgi:predicted amidophosphoribosyltransferase